jgi:lipopolysaccharide export system permease protein
VILATQILQLGDLVLGPGGGAASAGHIALYLAPQLLVTALPVALLLGIMIGLGRLAEDGELVALAATGRSPLQLYAVPVALALALAGVLFVLERDLAPMGARALRAYFNDTIKRVVSAEVRAGEFYDGFRRFTVYAAEVDRDEGRWGRVLLYDARGDGAPLLALAERGHLDPGAPGEVMRLELAGGEIHRVERGDADDYTVVRFAEGELALGLSDHQSRRNPFVRPLLEMTPPELLAASRYWQEWSPEFSRRLLQAWHRKHAVPADALIFALIAVPLAVSGGGRGRAFLATLGGFVAFYLARRLTGAMGDAGWVPQWAAAWAATALFAAAGLVLYARLALGRARLRRA